MFFSKGKMSLNASFGNRRSTVQHMLHFLNLLRRGDQKTCPSYMRIRTYNNQDAIAD